jgi:hypothetical protein
VTDIVAALRARLAHVGLDLVGATSVAAYDARMTAGQGLAPRAPEARGIVVVGNGGAALWRTFRAAVPAPAGDDPLDAFVRDGVLQAVRDVAGARVCWPSEARVDFRLLGELAGLGRPSLVGVLIHPVYGPWIALRAAILVPADVVAPRPADGFDPCPTCVERPCIAACPVGAIGPRGWDVAACVAHRLADEAHCAAGCTSRVECVYGREHHPPPDALAFHQAAARRSMLAYSGLAYASAARKD